MCEAADKKGISSAIALSPVRWEHASTVVKKGESLGSHTGFPQSVLNMNQPLEGRMYQASRL